MKYYTEIVPFEMAVKLKEAGYSKDYGHQYDESGELTDPAAPGSYEGICEAPTYAEVFDWLLEKGLSIEILTGINEWGYSVFTTNPLEAECGNFQPTWHEAVNEAIENALEFIQEEQQ